MSMHPGHAGRRTSEILRLKRRVADRADRGGAAVRVGGGNTHTGGRKGRLLTPQNTEKPSGQAYRRVFTPCFVCVFVCVNAPPFSGFFRMFHGKGAFTRYK